MRGAVLRHIAGVTLRQYEWWTERGYLVCENFHGGSGNGRDYPATEVPVARALAGLQMLRDMDPETVRRLAEAVRRGKRGRVELVPGVILDFDVLCNPNPTGDNQ